MLCYRMTLPAQKPRTTAWSPERRAKHAAAIRRWKPWTKSTGPKTASGKARAAQNATKHGRCAGRYRLLNQAFAAQRECVRLALLRRRLRVINPSNELLARLRCRFETCDHIFHVRLAQYLYYERLCKNLAFSGSFRQIVNANDN